MNLVGKIRAKQFEQFVLICVSFFLSLKKLKVNSSNSRKCQNVFEKDLKGDKERIDEMLWTIIKQDKHLRGEK